MVLKLVFVTSALVLSACVGFHRLKPGMRGSNGKFYGTGKSATFWVDDDEEYEEGEDSTAYLVRVTDAEVNLELHDVLTSASIRCIRN